MIKMNHLPQLSTFFLVWILSLSFVSAAPKGFVRIGDFEIVPNLTISGKFTTNLFSEADGLTLRSPTGGIIDANGDNKPDKEEEDDDFVYTISPRVDISYPGENVTLDFGYKIGFRQHVDFDNENNADQNFNLKLGLLSPSQRYKLGVGFSWNDTLELSNDDIKSEADNFQAEHVVGRLYASLDVLLGKKSTLNLGLSRTTDDFDDNAFDDEGTENTIFSVGYSRKIWEKTSAILNYSLGMLEYPDDDLVTGGETNSDSDNHSFRIGLGWDASAKVSGKATIGWTRKTFDDENATLILNPNTGAPLNNFDDTSDVTIGTSLSWKMRPKSTASLSLNRSLKDSSFRNSAFLTSSSLKLGLSQKMGEKITTSFSLGYTLSDYDDDTRFDGNNIIKTSRSDDKISAGVSLNYDLRDWVFWKAAYSFTDNGSDIDDREYTTNAFTVSIGTKF